MKLMLLNILDRLHFFSLFNKFTKNTATIFMLHKIAPEYERTDESISPELLEQFLKYIVDNGYNVLSLAQYIDAIRKQHETYKTVIFTVDDGYRDFYDYAYEIFKKYNFSATIFLTSDFIEKKLVFWWDSIEIALNATTEDKIDLNFMNGGEVSIGSLTNRNRLITKITNYCKSLKNDEKLHLIQELLDNLKVDIQELPKKYAPLEWHEINEMSTNGIDFQPHSKTHPIMSRIQGEQKKNEIIEPRRVIEGKLKNTANIFCYPNGGINDFDEETISLLKDAGYIAAVTGIPGFDHTNKNIDPFRIHRFGLPDHHLLFKQYVCGLESLKNKLRR